jgi:hypothetical protein
MANPRPPLSIVPPLPATGAEPPVNLGPAGCKLWRSILADYDITDAGGLLLLEQAAFAADRAERLREQIDADGEIIHGRTGPKEHPGLKAEIAARSLLARMLVKLGLHVEPLRPGPGRPPGR